MDRYRYYVPWRNLCVACNSDEASFDNLPLCKECWRESADWEPGVAYFAPWVRHRYRSHWPMSFRWIRYWWIRRRFIR